MKKIENVYIAGREDLRYQFRSLPITELTCEYLHPRETIFSANVIIFIDTDLKTIFLKNRYGNYELNNLNINSKCSPSLN